MGKPAARITDNHVCPMVTGTVPHVGGPISIGSPNVLTGGLPQARVGDMLVCVGPPDIIAMGSSGVFVNNKPAARLGDQTAHGGVIVVGLPTVLIGETGGASAGGALQPASGASLAYAAFEAQVKALMDAAKSGKPFCEICFQKALAKLQASLKNLPPVSTGLGKGVDKYFASSPTLKSNVDKLTRDGWTITKGKAGGGSYCNKDRKEIIVDSSETDLQAVQTLAHESGHALYAADPYVQPDGLTRDEYIKKNVNSSLKDEGEATLMNAQIRNEILNNKGPDIGIAGANAGKYAKVAAKYPDAADRDTARQEIGDIFADNEHPSTDPSKTYRQYYSKPYADFWDKTHKP